MSQNPLSVIEGVPVKISERYKPPPKISIPQIILQRLSAPNNTNILLNYDNSLELNVLCKLREWKEVRQREQLLRKNRIQKREDQKMKQIEENQKKMLTEVSYPSTEDLSSDDDAKIVISNDHYVNAVGHANQFDAILKPTVVPGNMNPDSACNSNTYAYNYNNTLNNFNASKINYSDFENDTSSPFDNMELKTMNDLDILAQVLKISAKLNNTDNSKSAVDEEKNECTTSNYIAENACQNLTMEQTAVETNNLEFFNNYYNSPNEAVSTIQFNMPTQTYDCLYQNYVTETSTNKKTVNEPNHTVFLQNVNYPNSNFFNHNTEYECSQNNIFMSPHIINTKSKSVPDIMKELHAEIKDSEMKRNRNNSQCIERSSDASSKCTSGSNNLLCENYKKLSHNLQNLAKNISSMGFPLTRVSRVVLMFGNDDKKVIEHLIPLSELLDLGFEEEKISEALMKFNNNKEKALDSLIS